MSRGADCSWCGYSQLHDKITHRECSKCGAIYWDLSHMGNTIKSGKGIKCRHCSNETLHWVANVPDEEDKYIYRCSICNATLIATKLSSIKSE